MVWHYPHGPKLEQEATNVALKGSIRAQFDRFIDPNTANRQAFCVNTGRPEECISAGSGPGSITFSVEYDPVDRVVVMKPQQPLMPMTRYNVRLIPPKNDSDTSGIRAFDGVALTEAYQFSFTTGDATAPAAEPNRAIDFCTYAETACAMPDAGSPTPVGESVSTLIGGTCAGESSCHSRFEPTPRLPWSTDVIGEAVILGESADAGGVAAAIRRVVQQRLVAPETAVDPDPGNPRTNGTDSFGRNMPFIDPKNPGNSYILYKMILGTLHCPAGPTDDAVDPLNCSGDKGGYGFQAQYSIDYYEYDAGGCNGTVVHQKGDLVPYPSWVPDAEWKSPAANEYQRLAFRIRGTSMPPNQGVAPQDIHRLSAWITAGAPVKDCPAQP